MLELQSLTLVYGQYPYTVLLGCLYCLAANLTVPLTQEVLGHGQVRLAVVPYLVKEF